MAALSGEGIAHLLLLETGLVNGLIEDGRDVAIMLIFCVAPGVPEQAASLEQHIKDASEGTVLHDSIENPGVPAGGRRTGT